MVRNNRGGYDSGDTPMDPSKMPKVPTGPAPGAMPMAKTSGVLAIGLERARQIEMGYTEEHDQQHPAEIFIGGARHLLGYGISHVWVRRSGDLRDDLVRAGALIAAAIDRLDAESGKG